MGKAAVKEGDKVKSTDIHTVVLASNGSKAPRNFSFDGALASGLSSDVKINGKFAALTESSADNSSPHNAWPDSFDSPPSNKGTVLSGSNSVKINGKPAVRHGDKATTCTEPPIPGNGLVEVADPTKATVFFGD